jgi:hypothetical protein
MIIEQLIKDKEELLKKVDSSSQTNHFVTDKYKNIN